MPAKKKFGSGGPPAGLALDLDGCRFDDSPPSHSRGPHGDRAHPCSHHRASVLSPLGSTYRSEGLSIGRDFLRHRGRTVSEGRGAVAFDVVGLVGRGTCSSVWRARCRSDGDDGGGGSRDEGGSGSDGSRGGSGGEGKGGGGKGGRQYYALKQFEMRDPRKRDMLRRELGILCSFRCPCLVGLEGAYLDGDGGDVVLVLEYMDRGSLADLMGGEDGAARGARRAIPIPERTIAAVGYQILWGLSFLHREGVLHRDVKVRSCLFLVFVF